MNKSPAATVKEQFGDKAKLVAALGPLTNDDLWVNRVNEAKGLARVSNAKLLKLFNVLSAVKDKFGNRFKLVDAICEIEKRAKDEGYKKRLLAYPVPRLYDLYCSTAHRSGVAAPARVPVARASAKAAAGTEKPSAKKPADKAPAAKEKAAGPKKKA